MPYPRLSPDIVALIHQSELNRAGWFDARKKNAISTLFWLENKPLSENDVMQQQAAVGRMVYCLQVRRIYLVKKFGRSLKIKEVL